MFPRYDIIIVFESELFPLRGFINDGPREYFAMMMWWPTSQLPTNAEFTQANPSSQCSSSFSTRSSSTNERSLLLILFMSCGGYTTLTWCEGWTFIHHKLPTIPHFLFGHKRISIGGHYEFFISTFCCAAIECDLFWNMIPQHTDAFAATFFVSTGCGEVLSTDSWRRIVAWIFSCRGNFHLSCFTAPWHYLLCFLSLRPRVQTNYIECLEFDVFTDLSTGIMQQLDTDWSWKGGKLELKFEFSFSALLLILE